MAGNTLAPRSERAFKSHQLQDAATLQTPTELQKSVSFIFCLEDFCPSSGQSQVFCNL